MHEMHARGIRDFNQHAALEMRSPLLNVVAFDAGSRIYNDYNAPQAT
jgi:hypothetical protein